MDKVIWMFERKRKETIDKYFENDKDVLEFMKNFQDDYTGHQEEDEEMASDISRQEEEGKCGNVHDAERHVQILTQLILHYGKEFLQYANDRKRPFGEIQQLGAQWWHY